MTKPPKVELPQGGDVLYRGPSAEELATRAMLPKGTGARRAFREGQVSSRKRRRAGKKIFRY